MKGQTDNLHPDLVAILQLLEDHMEFELTITSGYRTVEHNADPKVGGVKHSEHTYLPAEGVDIFCKQSATRWKMLQWLFRYRVKRIGIGKDFLHVGISYRLPEFVAWTYYPVNEPAKPVEV